MDDYIKRKDAVDAVLFALVGTGLQSLAIDAIKGTQTADVMPKSEAFKELFNEIERRLPTNRTFHSHDIQLGYAWAITSVQSMLNEIRAERTNSNETV